MNKAKITFKQGFLKLSPLRKVVERVSPHLDPEVSLSIIYEDANRKVQNCSLRDYGQKVIRDFMEANKDKAFTRIPSWIKLNEQS